MDDQPLKTKWWPLLLFVGLALTLAITMYVLPPPLRDVSAFLGFCTVICYVIFVGKLRPENLQGVLVTISTVLGPALANQFVQLQAPDLLVAMESAGVIVQTTFVMVGILTTFLFAIQKLITLNPIQGYQRFDILAAIVVAGGIAILLPLTPLTRNSGPSMHVLGMPMPQVDTILLFRVTLALLGVYLTLRPEELQS